MEYKNNAKDDGMTFLAYKSRTAKEVEKHLREKGYDRDEVEEAMEFLLDCSLVNDEKYCDDYIEREMEKGRGPSRISQQLSEKGVQGSLIQMKMEEWFDRQTEKEYALKAARKLWDRNRSSQEELMDEDMTWEEAQERKKAREKEMAKIARKLEYQGFRSGVIFDVLSRLR